MIKILHMADVHLDSPFSLRTPSEAERLRTELRGAFTSACLLASTGGINIVLIAGDLFDCEYVTADTKELLFKTFSSNPDVRFFISPGNHDPYTAGSVYNTLNFPENVHIFGEQPECVRLEKEGVCVYGRAFTSNTMKTSPLSGFGELDKDMINILVCHGETDPFSSTGPITKNEIAASGFDYIALGHIHAASGLQKEGGTYWCYPGCLVGRSFDETGKKGCMVGFVGKGECEMRFFPLSKRIYEVKQVELPIGSTKQDATELIRSQLRGYGSDTRLRLILTGEVKGGVSFNANELGALCDVDIIDRTVPCIDFTELEQSSTLKGVFYRLMKDKLMSLEAGSEDYYICLNAMKLGIAALYGRSIADESIREE